MVNQFFKYVKSFCWFISFSGFSFSLEVGELCYQNNGIRGICKIEDQCPQVADQERQGIPPTLCGVYDGSVPIFCCQDQIDRQRPFASNPFLNNAGEQHFNERPNFNDRPNRFNEYQPNNFNQRPFNNIPEANDNIFFNNDQDNNDPIAFPEEQTTKRQFNIFSRRKSDSKCEEYTKSVTDTVHAIPLVTNVEPISINVTKCPYNSVELIVGGTHAAAGQFPFMAALGFRVQNNIDWKCGGTLISDRFILTAAHCTFSRDSDGPVVIRLGALDLIDDSNHRDYKVEHIIPHPEYRLPQKYNDIGLIQSAEKIIFNDYIRPACLFTTKTISQSKALATGWGKTDFAGDNSDKLMKVGLTIYSNSICQGVYKNDRQVSRGIASSMLCAGELSGGKDTCQGDSGGPLLITEENNQCKFYVIGVTSFGKSCGQIQTPAVYTRVSEFVDWIESIVWN